MARVCAFDASVKCRGPARGPSEEWLTARPENSSWWKTAASIGPMQPLLPKSPRFSPPEPSPDVPQSSCIWCIWGIWTIVKNRNTQEIDAWEHWSYDWLQTPAGDVMSSEMVIGPLGLPIRYIQHQRLSDLYWQFLAEWEVHVERNPSEGTCPCFNTFSKRYLSHWKHVLVMRKVSQHGQCKLCFDLRQILQNTRVDWATKVTWSFISQQTAFGKQVFQCTVSCSQLQNQQLR